MTRGDAASPGRAATATQPPSRVVLADGTPAVVQRLVPEDEHELLALHERLSERDRYLRFNTLHPAHLARWVAQSLDPAGPALSLGARVRGTLVGVVELFPISAGTAEVAALVDRPWREQCEQGLVGLGPERADPEAQGDHAAGKRGPVAWFERLTAGQRAAAVPRIRPVAAMPRGSLRNGISPAIR